MAVATRKRGESPQGVDEEATSTRMTFAGPLSLVQAAQQRNSTEIDNITILPVAVRFAAKRSMLVIRDTVQGFEVPAQLKTGLCPDGGKELGLSETHAAPKCVVSLLYLGTPSADSRANVTLLSRDKSS